MTIMTPERRLFDPAVRAVDNVETTDSLSRLSGRAIPYNTRANIGWFLETFLPGSLGKSIRESAKALPLNLFHNASTFPIGAAESWDERDDGLYGVWKLDDHPDAQRAAKLAADGVLNFLSIGFAPVENRTDWTVDDLTGMDHAIRREARLLETSLVSTPAYKDATVTWVRSTTAKRGDGSIRRPQRDLWRGELDKLRG